MPTARKTKPVKKDRAQDLLNEMANFRKEKEELGSIDFLSRGINWKHYELVARGLLRDAGLDISKKRHVHFFLGMVAQHLHGQFAPGTRRIIPIDDFTLLNRACAAFQAGKGETTAAISRKLHESSDLNHVKLNTVRNQLRRLVIQAVAGQKIRGIPTDELAALMPTLKKIKVERGAKPPA